MKDGSHFRWTDFLWFVVVVALAAGTRSWYLYEYLDGAEESDPPFLAQTPSPPSNAPPGTEYLGKENPTELDNLVHNIVQDDWFGSYAPLSSDEEETAHIAPGYPWLVSLAYRAVETDESTPLIRWTQCALGAVTAGLYFYFARMAFGNLFVALLAGLLCAFHPFWVVNTGQLTDGVVTSFLVAACLVLGTRSVKTSDVACSLLFGFSLAALSLVRAALFPFAFVGLLWFLLRCQSMQRGWFFALLAVLGFLNGVAPWTVRNVSTCRDIVPIVDSAWLHLWMGNNPHSTGVALSEQEIKAALGETRYQELQNESSQYQGAQHYRYQLLTEDLAAYVTEDPVQSATQIVKQRIRVALYFLLGQAWFDPYHLPGQRVSATDEPAEFGQYYQLIINATMLGMLLLGFLGWRWTRAWNQYTGLATLAVMWIPLPYLLSHAETLWGPRLPLDGVLLCYSAFALACLIPGLRGSIVNGPQPGPREV